MFILLETTAGYELFKILDEGKLSKVESLGNELSTLESARKVVKLEAVSKFENTAEALSAATSSLIDSKPTKGEKKKRMKRKHAEPAGESDDTSQKRKEKKKRKSAD